MPMFSCRKSYNHRLRDLTCEEVDPKLFHHIGLPRSTAASWIRRGQRPVVSASKTNEDWHIDVTVIKLLDGARTYLHAVIDNFSRRIVAWRLAPRLEPQDTCLVLIEAVKNLSKDGDGATVIADSGIENVNGEVDNLWGLGQLHRILAQVEVSYSNSMIEALWRSMKHGWLFLHQLDIFAALEKMKCTSAVATKSPSISPQVACVPERLA